MAEIRPAAVAGLFYPERATVLAQSVQQLLAAAARQRPEMPAPKAVIAPHAGYVYSGPIAASVYARLRPLAARIRRVVLIGPCHRVPLRGLAVPTASAFATPLGRVAVDRDAVTEVLKLPMVRAFDETHADEHCLEVQLPFLQQVLKDFAIVPIIVGDARPEEVATVLERLWGGEETLIVVSSDLSHYHDYQTAAALDAATCRAIETLDGDAISFDQACGRIPIQGLLKLARDRGLAVATLDLRNSGDTAGDRRRVVGYGAWAFWEDRTRGGGRHAAEAERGQDEARPEGAHVVDRHGAELLRLASAAIDHGLTHGRAPSVAAADYPPALQEEGASFVTLFSGGALRGCVGSAEAYRPLAVDVAANAFAAAFRDNRFARLEPAERNGLSLSVSVLSGWEPLACGSERELLDALRPGADGLIIESRRARALFLPQVWKTLPVPEQFLAQLKLKAGLPAGRWPADVRAWRFAARSVAAEALTGTTGIDGQ